MTVDPSLASNKAVRDLSSLISGSNFNGLVNALERLVMADWAVSQEASGGGYGDDGEAEDSLVSFRELEAVLPKEVACVKMLRLKYCITLPNKVRHHRTAPRPVPPHLATPPPQLPSPHPTPDPILNRSHRTLPSSTLTVNRPSSTSRTTRR